MRGFFRFLDWVCGYSCVSYGDKEGICFGGVEFGVRGDACVCEVFVESLWVVWFVIRFKV